MPQINSIGLRLLKITPFRGKKKKTLSLFRLIPVEKRVWPDQILQQKARGFSHLARLNGNPALHWCTNWTVSKVGVGVISAFSQDGTMAFFMLKESAMQRLCAEMCQCYNEIMVKNFQKMSLSHSNCRSICVIADHKWRLNVHCP